MILQGIQRRTTIRIHLRVSARLTFDSHNLIDRNKRRSSSTSGQSTLSRGSQSINKRCRREVHSLPGANADFITCKNSKQDTFFNPIDLICLFEQLAQPHSSPTICRLTTSRREYCPHPRASNFSPFYRLSEEDQNNLGCLFNRKRHLCRHGDLL